MPEPDVLSMMSHSQEFEQVKVYFNSSILMLNAVRKLIRNEISFKNGNPYGSYNLMYSFFLSTSPQS